MGISRKIACLCINYIHLYQKLRNITVQVPSNHLKPHAALITMLRAYGTESDKSISRS